MTMIKHIQSTEHAPWQEAAVSHKAGGDTLRLTGKEKQRIKGFGGCFNEIGWEALLKLPEDCRSQYLDQLYTSDGCNFNMGRLPIGANDFSLEWYSCDEVRDDFELKHFNIERDKQYTIPFIREAMARREDLCLFASPWSPPTWMKTRPVYNYGQIRMEDQILDCYARYFVKFVKAYMEEGIDISMVHVQNEPMADQKFPSCKWSGPDMRDFIKGYLGPQFKKSGLSTEIWLGTINGPFLDMMLGSNTPFSEFYDQWVNTVLSDREARKYISGIGLQWGGKHILEQLECAWPEIPIMQTESECGDGANTWEHMEYIYGLMWQYFRHGAERYTYWNMALPDGGVSTWGWSQNSLCTVDTNTLALKLQPEFYLMKHFSHFVKPGAVYLEAAGIWGANSLVFRNPDDTVVVIVGSAMNQDRSFTFEMDGKSFSAEIPAHSLHTFLIRQ